ncbi:MAG: curli assembly protein CsgG [Sulfuricurvum sp.]|nr:curli assembly protein CsgG [Sulfuricurvum sp.]
MKKFYVGILSLVTYSILGLADEDTKVQQIVVPVNKCSAPVLSIAISNIECKAQSCQDTGVPSGGIAALAALASGQGNVKGIGSGVKSMLTNAMKESKCFKIVDLEQFEKVKQMMVATGQEVKPPKIDLIITGVVSSVDISKEGGALAGGVIPIVGMFSKNTSKASIGVEFTAMNPTTLEMSESKSFQANSEKSSWGFLGMGGPAGGGWSVTKNVALDNVIRDVVFSATNYFTDTYAKDNIVERPKVEPAS